MSKQTYKTAVRLVFVIDATGSMDDFSVMIKDFLHNSYEKITKALDDAGRKVEQLEIQLVTFRDWFEEKGEEAFHMSRVFNLATDKEEFDKEVDSLTWFGGGDDPESSLQALYLTLKNSPKLITDYSKKRFIIFLLTDNPSHGFEEFEKRGGKERYPEYPVEELPATLNRFNEEYHGVQRKSLFEEGAGVDMDNVRLNIWAPQNAYPFDADNIGGWLNVTKIPVKENGNLEDVTSNVILATIAASC